MKDWNTNSHQRSTHCSSSSCTPATPCANEGFRGRLFLCIDLL